MMQQACLIKGAVLSHSFLTDGIYKKIQGPDALKYGGRRLSGMDDQDKIMDKPDSSQQDIPAPVAAPPPCYTVLVSSLRHVRHQIWYCSVLDAC
jgi:hypothetical protein